MLNSLITSKTRLKLILKFFLNPDTSAHLRGLANEFGESTNGIRVELNRLTEAGLLEANHDNRNVFYKANLKHMLFPEINSIVRKYLGIDQMVETIVKELGNVELALVTGDYAQGVDSGLVDLVIVGDVDKEYLHFLIAKTEDIISRKVRVLVLNKSEFKMLIEKFKTEKLLYVWGEPGNLESI